MIDDDWVERKGRWDNTRNWAVGQALGATRLLKTLTDAKRGHAGLFPELSLFDCHACHHLMSDRRDFHLRSDASLGRARLNDSSLLMLRQIAARVDPAGAGRFNAQVDRLTQAIASGDDALDQARATIQECDRVLGQILAHRNFTNDDLRAMLRGLVEQGLNGGYADYQSAEQATMAMQGLADLMSRTGALRAAGVQPIMKRMLATLANDEAFKPKEFESTLRDLRGLLEGGVKR
jgi:hypothetical protein